MAYINVDEVYILDNTGLQVDMATDIPFADAGFSDDQKAQARKNIAAGGSNPNLLDNWYFVGGGSQLGDGVFPINQRGQTTYTGGPAFDRWRNYTSNLTLNSNGVTIEPTAYGNNFLQFLPSALWDSLVGKTLTLSFDVAAITGSFVISAYNTAAGNLTQTGITSVQITIPSGVIDANKFFGLGGNAGNSVTLRAVKLELGTVSTLANDAPPDFGEELEKCYRRLWYPIFYANQVVAAGLAFGDSAIFDIVTPVEMAGLPQIALGGSWYVAQNGSLTAITGTPTATFKTANHLRVQVGLSSNITAYTPVVLLAGEYQGDKFDCEL